MQEIELPDGTILEFPSDMSDSAIRSTVQREYPDIFKSPWPMPEGSSYAFGEAPTEQSAALMPRQRPAGSGAMDIESRRGTLGGESPYFTSMMRSMQNTPASAARFAGDLAQAVVNPVETIQGIGKVAAGYGQKAVGYNGEYTPYADAVNKHFSDRYGGFGNAVNTLENDPIGMLGDTAAVFTGIGGAGRLGSKAGSLAAKAVPAARSGANAVSAFGKKALDIGKSIDPANLMAQGAGRAAAMTRVPEYLGGARDFAARKLYLSAIKPSVTLTPAERASLARTGVEYGLVPNQAGVDKLQGIIKKYAREADDLVAAREALERAGKAPVSINPDKIAFDAFNDVFGKYGNQATPELARKIIARSLDEFLGNYGKQNIGTELAHTMKKNTYKAAEDAYTRKHPGPKLEMQKALARGLKEGLEANVPGLAAVNKQLSPFLNLRDDFLRGVNRTDNLNPLSLSSSIFGSAAAGLPQSLSNAAAISFGGWPTNKARAAIGLDRTKNILPWMGRMQVPAQFGRMYQSTEQKEKSGLLDPEYWK